MVSLFKGALFAALLAYNALSVRDAARAAAQAFLAPAGAGAPPAPGAPLPADALAAHAALRFVADMHASPMLASRDVLVRGARGAALAWWRAAPVRKRTRMRRLPAFTAAADAARCRAAAGACVAALQLAQVQSQQRGES
jgi:hypothetical protein